MDRVGILVIDDDAANQSALQQILDAEGWDVQPAPIAAGALQELATGKWTLVIASIGMTGLSGPLYMTLRELALVPLSEEGKARLRVLFMIPEAMGQQARPVLEGERLPYLQKPFNLHELLDRVSDLLMETQAIVAPIRRVRDQGLLGSRNYRGRNAAADRNTGMFANREEYVMTEEEIAEYERHETEETLRRKKKKLPGME